MVSPAGFVTTLSGSGAGFGNGSGATALFNQPSSVAIDWDGIVVVSESFNQCIRKISAGLAPPTLSKVPRVATSTHAAEMAAMFVDPTFADTVFDVDGTH